MAYNIRTAVPEDADTIVSFIRALAEFERFEPKVVKVSTADILKHGFGERPAFECLIAELDGRPVGFALFFTNYSTFEGRPGIYLEDLFVHETARGHGIGRALVAELARIAVERDATRLEFAVLDWNPARRFYTHIGAEQLHDWLPYRVEGAALRVLAG